jgi:hypothetical protein
MNNIVEFPIADKPITEDEIDELHSEAFRDLEGHICDCVHMGELAAELMVRAKGADGKLCFAVFHLTEMLLNLKKHHYAAWDGERPASRLITSAARTAHEVKEACGSLPAEDINEAPAPITS